MGRIQSAGREPETYQVINQQTAVSAATGQFQRKLYQLQQRGGQIIARAAAVAPPTLTRRPRVQPFRFRSDGVEYADRFSFKNRNHKEIT